MKKLVGLALFLKVCKKIYSMKKCVDLIFQMKMTKALFIITTNETRELTDCNGIYKLKDVCFS